MSKDDSGPAFPVLAESCQRMNESEWYPGMSLRDYFAAAALQGMLANPKMDKEFATTKLHAAAFGHADALLWERNK